VGVFNGNIRKTIYKVLGRGKKSIARASVDILDKEYSRSLRAILLSVEKAKIHSIETKGLADGFGIKVVVFLQRSNLL